MFDRVLNSFLHITRSSPPEVSIKKGVFKNFAKFTGKHLCQSLFFNKIAGRRPATSLKKRLWHRCFPENFVKFLRTPFLTEHLWWLLLYKCEYIKQLQEHVLVYSTTTIRDFRYKTLHIPTYLDWDFMPLHSF